MNRVLAATPLAPISFTGRNFLFFSFLFFFLRWMPRHERRHDTRDLKQCAVTIPLGAAAIPGSAPSFSTREEEGAGRSFHFMRKDDEAEGDGQQKRTREKKQ